MSLSRKDIIAYKTTLDSSRKNEIELKVIDDDFERDSLDGWSENKVSIQQLKSLDRKINFNIRTKLFLSSFITVIVISIIVVIVLNSKGQLEKKPEKDKKSITITKSIISKDSITSFKELPKKLQIKPDKIKTDFAEKQLIQVTIEPIVSNQEPIHLPLKNLDKLNSTRSKRENIAKETYLNDLKIIDYRYYRTRPTESLKDEFGGTPANLEKNDNRPKNLETSLEYTYFSYLDKTLKYFNKNNFKTALNRFEVILETYPDDVNALFYSAICLYNLNQFELCENRLIQLENSRFTNFDQEQKWYLLLVYKALEKKGLFDTLRQDMINNKGFYVKQAQNLMFK